MDNYADDVFIILNDWDSRDYNIRVMELGMKSQASLKYNLIEPFGKDGFVKIDEGAYRGFDRTSSLLVGDDESYQAFINTFYIGLEVKAFYSDDDNKFRKGIIKDIKDNIVFQEYRQLGITIQLEPFKWGIRQEIEVVEQIQVINQGNAPSLPLIKVEGTGEGIVYVNGKEMKLNLTETLYIDNENIDILYESGARANSKRLSGDFFKLRAGENTLNISGGITKATFYVNWRWF